MNSMIKKMNFRESRDLLLSHIVPVASEKLPLDRLFGRILAEDVKAGMNVPHYDRSPLDGYAVRSSDTKSAGRDSPVTLKVIGEIRAGDSPDLIPGSGEAVKILTGAPVPEGADAVIRYEDTKFSEDYVTVCEQLLPDQNIIRAGEDVRAGDVIATRGMHVDLAVVGMLASQGMAEASVHKRLKVAVICTGNEIAEVGTALAGSQIYNSNRHMLAAALARDGYEAEYMGCAGDDTEQIAGLLLRALGDHDAVVLTGGVSAGDYDLVPEALERIGADIMVHGVKIKPGMACVYGFYRHKPCIALSGNPASALTNYYCIASSLLKKYSGAADYVPELIRVTVKSNFGKKGGGERILRGSMRIDDGMVCMYPSCEQGNVVISSLRAADLFVIVPEDHGPVKENDVLDGFLI